MKIPFTGLLFLNLLSFASCAQNKADTNAATGTSPTKATIKPLTINLALADNTGRSRLALTLTNTGNNSLPASGWTMYFNSGSATSTDSNVAQVTPVNGDFYSLKPGPAFKAIAPGQSETITIQDRHIRNITDFPIGFYLVFDSNLEEAFPVGLTVNKGNQFDKADQQLAEKIYDQNATIQSIQADKVTRIFPTPVSYQETGQSFVLDKQVVIVADKAFTAESEVLANALATVVGTKPAIRTQASGKSISLRKKAGIAPEGYELQINQTGITLTASEGAGLFYGIQSLQTLMPPGAVKSGSVSLPGLVVNDAPRFPYRAFMMDVARNFQPKSEVLKVLDLLALYKFNTLHLHFSDDEGWRVEMPSLPELTTVGGKRAYSANQKESIVSSYGSGPSADNTSGTGFYSKADFVEILRYAHERHINVIPEIESPGHARAALRAMDARYERLMKMGNKAEAERYLLRDLTDQSVYRSVQGWNDNVIDVSLPSVYAFMERVADDLRAMYTEAGAPLNTIHYGGDEVPKGVWQKSPSAQRLMAQNAAIKTTQDLWEYYFGKLDKALKSRGLYLSGWEEIGLTRAVKNGRSIWVPNPVFAGKNFHVNVWQNSPGSGAEDLAYRLANAGYKVILTPVTHLYLDLAYNTSSEEPGQYWGGYVDIDKPFYFIPYDYLRNFKDDKTGKLFPPSVIKSREPLTAAGRANIVGIEAPLWSEKILSPDQLEYKLLPKLLSVAERAWAKDPAWATGTNTAQSDQLYTRAWSEFIHTLSERELPRLDTYAGGFQYRIPTAGAKIVSGKLAANVQLPGMTIRYTTDGTEPTASSPMYTEPIAATGTIKLKVFNKTGRSGQTVTIQ
ncbi:family 20 glycosylhydrolase [Spirosoma spitsbergense]|uniref:family 20 glycosylhydrolase n=1 Tax=Spirosoma spitsbergense TaxID=431554 RepID=UPI00037DE77F|nr:family 20 glycosylhydrolase [Spirosoma spitsbergense]